MSTEEAEEDGIAITVWSGGDTLEKTIERAEMRGAEWAFRFSLAHLQSVLRADVYETVIRESALAVVAMYKHRKAT